MRFLKSFAEIALGLLGVLSLLSAIVVLFGGMLLAVAAGDCGISIEPGWHECRDRGFFDNPGAKVLLGSVGVFTVLALVGGGCMRLVEKLGGPIPVPQK